MAQRPHQPAFDEIVVHQRSPGESDAEPVGGRFDRQVRIAEARSIEPLHPEAGARKPVLPGAAAAILLGAGIVQQHMTEQILRLRQRQPALGHGHVAYGKDGVGREQFRAQARIGPEAARMARSTPSLVKLASRSSASIRTSISG